MLTFSGQKKAFAESAGDFPSPVAMNHPNFMRLPFAALKSFNQFLPNVLRFRSTFKRWLFLISAIAILTPSSHANAEAGNQTNLNTELLSPANVFVSPGEILITSIQVTNNFQDRRTIRIRADVPINWGFSIDPGILELGPGITNIAFISLTVPIDASPGESEIILSAFPEGEYSQSSSVRVNVTITKVTSLDIQPSRVNQPDTYAGDRITQTFILSNFGNSTEHVRIEVQTNHDWDFDVEPSDPIHIMEPGQTDTISIVVHTPQNLASPANLHLTLYARLDEPESETAAQAAMSTRVITSQPSPQSIYPSLHGNSSLILDLVNNEEAAASLEIGPLRCDIGEDRQLVIGPVNLLLGGSTPGTFIDDQRISASYEDGNLGYIRAGDFSLDLGSPLLEHYLWGRGGDILYKTDNIDYRVFYTRTRSSRPETDAGVQVVFDIGETGTARLTALRNIEFQSAGEQETCGSSVTNIGLYTAFEPFEGATIGGELAGTYSSNSDFDEAWRLSGMYRTEGLSLSYEMLQAGDDFRGGYQDTRIGRFDMSWRPLDNISLWTNYYVSRGNIDDNPDEETIHERDFTLGGAWTIDDFGRLSVTQRSERIVDVTGWSLDERMNSTEYSYSTIFDNIFASAIWRFQTTNNQLTSDIERKRSVQFQCVARVNGSTSLRFNLTSGQSSLNNGESTRHFRSASLGCDLRLSRDFDLSLNIERNSRNLSGQRTSIVGSLGWAMPEGRRLYLRYRGLTGSFGHSTEMVLEYNSPINMSLDAFPIKGRLEGRIYLSNDPDRGIPDVRVLADGFEAVTNDSGNFMFPALLPGEYELNLDYATLDIGLTPEIDLPSRFAVEAGSTVEIEIPMIRSVSIGGYIRLESPAADSAIQPDVPLGGILIELQRESGSDFRYADDLGHFVFANLEPGAYILKIRTEFLPQYIEAVDSTEYTIHLAPGEDISDVDFLLRPVEREIDVVLPSD